METPSLNTILAVLGDLPAKTRFPYTTDCPPVITSEAPGMIRISAPMHKVMPLLTLSVDPASTVKSMDVVPRSGHASRERIAACPLDIIKLTTGSPQTLLLISTLVSEDGAFPPSQFVPTSQRRLFPLHSIERHGAQHAMQTTTARKSTLSSPWAIPHDQEGCFRPLDRCSGLVYSRFDRCI